MDTNLQDFFRVIPEAKQDWQRRVQLLRLLQLQQPLGRRLIAQILQGTERIIRDDLTVLKDAKLIETSRLGVTLSKDGIEWLQVMGPIIQQQQDLQYYEEALQQRLQVERVYVLPGDCDENPWTQKELGRKAAQILRNEVRDGDVIAVNGGTSMAMMATYLLPWNRRAVTFVPARGSLGEEIKYEASTIAVTSAQHTGSTYKVFNLPEQMSTTTIQSLLKEEYVQDWLQLLQNARLFLHGIGEATTMAERRRLPREILKRLEEGAAVGEAYGTFFTAAGDVVYETPTIGLHLQQGLKVERVIALAGGKSKGKAIQAVVCYGQKAGYSYILITDVGAAQAILST